MAAGGKIARGRRWPGEDHVTPLKRCAGRHGIEADGRAQPIGFSLMAIGFVGLVLSLKRGRSHQENPNSQPPAPRWGRGADKS